MVNNSKNDWVKLSGVGLEIAIILFILTWGGNYLDKYFEQEKPWLTILGALIGMGFSVFLLIQMTTNEK
ncbi:Putative F0F1-ATPase subunit (ATPase_gene1) [Candidatus Ornithobacterium hominis]|uniref:F0F1-ATPase subunit (ATPase_gene1) n=1 Tax=Candidatus Ornithobacterium hominis TaxID=2497989 RepID=A0A383TTC1_9FLAO|nr:AtpZ/AtpI family protein [Candidatus Ornithobacterium hominis]MCT7903586.1 AtpZ/AtpI family protein [Candidatus Ornithobacterium hominis]SZD70922.1 Putative F0F1-ATPase subunit (ATPase_gene1) [Candidatus Ornithobacterium hominis]SZD71475.1 Putative F0F1-ATPase subunit (ATPase_gene1) [Candidatus Ornithobacterium hominis]